MDEQSAIQLALAGNDIALQWFLITHPGSTAGNYTLTSSPTGTSITAGSGNVAVLLILALAAFFLVKS